MALGKSALPAHVHSDVMVVIGIAHEPQSLSSSCDSERLTFGRIIVVVGGSLEIATRGVLRPSVFMTNDDDEGVRLM